MEQVLNAKERMQAFWRFILFFAISVICILLCVFFFYQVPKKENAFLRKNTDLYQQHTNSEEKFTAAMQDATSLIDSLDKPGANVAYLNQLIGRKLTDMTLLKDNTDVSSKQNLIFLNIINMISRYQDAKTKLISLKDVSAQLDKAKNDYLQCNQQLEQAKNTIAILRQSGEGNY